MIAEAAEVCFVKKEQPRESTRKAIGIHWIKARAKAASQKLG